jgi:hypothetical protein
MARNNKDFSGASDSARGAESPIDHEGIAMGVIRSGQSPAQKIKAITNHPTMPTAMKNWALDTITKIHGGGGVSPSVTEATAARQPSSGAPSSTPAPPKRANPFPVGSALHEYHEINPKPHGPNIRPSEIHSSYDSYAEEKISLKPEQAYQNTVAEKAGQEFDAIQKIKQEQERAGKTGRVPDSSRGSRAPKRTARTRGVNVPQTMGTNEFAQKLTEAHSQLTHMKNSLHGLNIAPEAAYGLNAAKNNISEGLASILKGNELKDGYKEGNKVYKSSEAAHPHYISAHKSLQEAHDLLADSSIQSELRKNNISAELPSRTLSELKTHIPSLPVPKKSAKPYSRMATGRYQSITAEELKDETSAKNIENIERVTGKDSRLSESGRATIKGYPRKNKFIARIENRKVSDSDLAKPATKENPLPKPTGGVPRSEDPRARSSDARVDVNFTGGTPTEGKMPTFEGTPEGKPVRRKRGK